VGQKFAGVAEGGVIVEPLLAVQTGTSLRLTGSFGVFFPGRTIADFLGAGDARLGRVPLVNADPVEILNLNQDVRAPSGTLRVRVSIEGQHGENRGTLADAAVTGNS
jgi:hypothetical protein